MAPDPASEAPQATSPSRWGLSPLDLRLLALLLLVSLGISLAFNAIIVPGYGPDEGRHFPYIQLLVQEHRLPFLVNGHEYHDADALHPPLYYVCLIPFYVVGSWFSKAVAWHLTRFGSSLFCLGALPLLYTVARRCTGSRGAFLATMMVGWIPMWGMTAGTVNNDAGSFFAASLLLWLLAVRYPDNKSVRAALWFGLALGLGTLMKATVLLCGLSGYLVYLVAQEGRGFWRLPSSWRRLGAVLLVTVLVAGWWHARSMMLYGTWTPLPPPMPLAGLPPRSAGILMTIAHPLFPSVFAIANWKLFVTIWSQKDWLLLAQIPVPAYESARLVLYLLFLGYVVVGLGLLLVLRGRAQPRDVGAKVARWAAPVAFVLTWITVLQVALFYHWGWAEGGRYLLPALFGLTLSCARGYEVLPRNFGRCVVGGMALLVLGCNGIAWFWLTTYLNPTFAPR